MWIFWVGNHRINIFLSYIEPDMIYFSSIFPAGLNEEQRSGLKEGKATWEVNGGAGDGMSRYQKGRRRTRKASAFQWGGSGGVRWTHCTDKIEADWHKDAFGDAGATAKQAQAAFAWLVSSPGYFDVLVSPCKSRLSGIYSAALYNVPFRSLTVHPWRSKMLFPAPPWVKKAHRGLQIVPSSHFQFWTFKNKKEMEGPGFCFHVSIRGCLTGARWIALGAKWEKHWPSWPPKTWWQEVGWFCIGAVSSWSWCWKDQIQQHRC